MGGLTCCPHVVPPSVEPMVWPRLSTATQVVDLAGHEMLPSVSMVVGSAWVAHVEPPSVLTIAAMRCSTSVPTAVHAVEVGQEMPLSELMPDGTGSDVQVLPLSDVVSIAGRGTPEPRALAAATQVEPELQEIEERPPQLAGRDWTVQVLPPSVEAAVSPPPEKVLPAS